MKELGVAVTQYAAFKISAQKDFSMQFQPLHKLVATPNGIFLDDEPLHKSALNTLSERSLFHLLRANEILAKMTAKDWEPPAPHGPNDIPLRAQLEMHLALANPGLLNKYSPDQPRDCNGRWTCGDTAPSWVGRVRRAHADAAENGGQRATHLAQLDSSPFGSSSGSGSFSPAPTPFDVFAPGTPANDAAGDSLVGIINAVSLPKTDSCKEEERAHCAARCGSPSKVKGCYVSVRWKTRRFRPGTGGYLKEEERIVNCNCDDESH